MSTESSKTQRVTLTKAQRESQIGADLLALCQSITSDGSLADEEIIQIREWLSENKASELPAIMFLIPIVETILEDGVVSDSERRELAMAVERVLPPDVRGISKAARVAIENEEKDKQRAARESDKAAKEAERTAKREQNERNRPVARFDFMVAGTRYEGRSKIIERKVDEGDSLTLVRDTGNRHSRNATGIIIESGEHIGFVPEEDAVDLAPLLDSGYQYTAHVKKVLTGGRSPIPVALVSVFKAEANISHKKNDVNSYASNLRTGFMSIFIALVVIGIIVKTCAG